MKTEKQWNELGYKVLNEAGTTLWTNRHCGQIATYYSENEVEPMTQQDIEEYRNKQRKINREKRALYEATKEGKFISIGEEIGVEKGKKSQFLKDLKAFGYKIVMVDINEKDSILHYVVPNNIDVGYAGRFPYGREILTGIVTNQEVDIQELKRSNWFPDRIRMMIIE